MLCIKSCIIYKEKYLWMALCKEVGEQNMKWKVIIVEEYNSKYTSENQWEKYSKTKPNISKTKIANQSLTVENI